MSRTHIESLVNPLGKPEGLLRAATDRDDLLSSSNFIGEALDDWQKRIDKRSAKILSFDVFDTYLLRNEKCELRRFNEIAKLCAVRLSEAAGAELKWQDFLAARIAVSRIAYRTAPKKFGCREGTLRDIHAGVLSILGLPESLLEQSIGLELSYEIENLKLNPTLAAAADAFGETCGIITISDMYMETNQIKHLIDHHDGNGRIQQVFSSANEIVSKRSGLIFEQIERALGASPSDFLHFGDSLVGDFRQPLKRGWGAIHLPIPDELVRRRRQDFWNVHKEIEDAGLHLGTWMNQPEV